MILKYRLIVSPFFKVEWYINTVKNQTPFQNSDEYILLLSHSDVIRAACINNY